MNRTATAIISAMSIAAMLPSCSSDSVPQLGKAPVDKVIKAMTLDEKVHLLIGTGMAGFSGEEAVVGQTQSIIPGASGTTYPIDRLGIPAIVLADGPAGLRISPTREGSPDTYYCTAFPVGTLLASTWNAELIERVGQGIGEEVLEYGADILLAPALNIQRNALCGRNFEYYSEDPVVAGRTAAAMVRGIQSKGVGTSVKHFAVNNQETNRMGSDSRLSVRALREIYLKGFEITVKESSPWTVMSSYNYINGVYASQSRELLTDILRGEWNYKGTVMTDWFGGRNPSAQVHAGNDLLMPGTPKQFDAIMAAVAEGSLSVTDIDVNVKRILELILASPTFKGYARSDKPDLKAHAELGRQAATEGMVLLKNEGEALPVLSKKIAAFGITTSDYISGGTGSGDVNKAYNVSLKEGLLNAGYLLDSELTAAYDKYISAEKEKNKPDPNDRFAMFMPQTRIAEMPLSPSTVKKAAAENDIAIVTIGRTSGEFADRKLPNDFYLSATELAMIREVSSAFKSAGKKTVVVLNIGGVIETASWRDMPDAILLAWQAGQEGGNSAADILSGKVNPSGKLTMSFPVDYMDAASSANFPYDYVSGAPVFSMEETVKTELAKNVDYTVYEEDIYVGYRYFDTFGKSVAYPFGYGLSYSGFDFEAATVTEKAGVFTFSCTVRNTGATAGKEVVQLYISAPARSMNKPAKELKAFVKTKLLQAGETQTVQLSVPTAELASFDEGGSRWVVEAGDYTARFGSSSQEIKQQAGFTVAKETVVATVNNVLAPVEPINIISR